MLTRITRYTLLVLCLLTIGVWAWSLFRAVGMVGVWREGARQVSLDIAAGKVGVYWFVDWEDRNEDGIYCSSNRYEENTQWTDRLGLPAPRFQHVAIGAGRSDQLTVPLWIILAPLVLLNIAIWYRPIRNRLRGKHDAGFAVEPKQPEPAKE